MGRVLIRLTPLMLLAGYHLVMPLNQRPDASPRLHVGVNFGPQGGLELFVDGKPSASIGVFSVLGQCMPGDPTRTLGLDGNDEPVVLGAATWASCPDDHQPATQPLHGAIAAVRISNMRRDFATLWQNTPPIP